MTNTAESAYAALVGACSAAGLDHRGAAPIRVAENQIWRLVGGVIARIAPPDRLASAAREVRVARWLADQDIRAVRPVDVEQPLKRAGRVVTFWEEVPPHRHGTATDVALALKELHSLVLPEFDIGVLDPFVRVPERLAAAVTLPDDDRQWLVDLCSELKVLWETGLPNGMPLRAIHGDAWPGNIVRTGEGRLLMDFERFSVGPPEWDLVSTAVRCRTTGAVGEPEYAEYCAAYGYDVTEWTGYDLLARARELRMATYAAQHAASDPKWRAQAQYRVDCLRGGHGPRPWTWKGIT